MTYKYTDAQVPGVTLSNDGRPVMEVWRGGRCVSTFAVAEPGTQQISEAFARRQAERWFERAASQPYMAARRLTEAQVDAVNGTGPARRYAKETLAEAVVGALIEEI